MKKILIFFVFAVFLAMGCQREILPAEKISNVSLNVSSHNGSIVLSEVQQPYLWRIEGGTPSYLFGTAHIPDKRLLLLPSVLNDAIDSSDAIYLEVTDDYHSMGYARDRSVLSENKTLKDVLPTDLYDRLDNYLFSKGVSILLFNQFKVWLVVSEIESIDYFAQSAVTPTIDDYMGKLGKKRGKEVYGIEILEEHIQTIDGLSEKDQIMLLNLSLNELEKKNTNASAAENLLQGYFSGGDMKLILEQNSSDSNINLLEKRFYFSLFENRDTLMAGRIDELLSARPQKSYFFAFGAAHVTENGVLGLLKKKGYNITKVDFPASGSCKTAEISLNGKCYYPYQTNLTIDQGYQFKPKNGCKDYSVQTASGGMTKISKILANDLKLLVETKETIAKDREGQIKGYDDIALENFGGRLVGFVSFMDDSGKRIIGNGSVTTSIYEMNDLDDKASRTLLYRKKIILSREDFKRIFYYTGGEENRTLGYFIDIDMASFEKKPAGCLGEIEVSFEDENSQFLAETLFMFIDLKKLK